MRRAALAAAVVAAMAATVAGGGGDALVRDCGTRVESGGRPFAFRGLDDVAVGPVSFWFLERAADGRWWRAEDGRFFVKTHLSIRAGRAVTISVGERYRDRIGLVRTSSDEPAATVRFLPCSPGRRAWSYDGTIGAVTGFNGGFKLTRRGCYPLEVRVEDGRARRVRVAFGYPCR